MSGKDFQWPKVRGKRVNLDITNALEAMTLGHCSYCDGYPLKPLKANTIDHFRPKEHYRHLALAWRNMFVACPACQSSKSDWWHAKLLRPDARRYSCERFFLVDQATGTLEVNPGASAADQSRARKTIELLGLNDHDRPTDRLRALRQFSSLASDSMRRAELPEFAYRYMLEAAFDVGQGA